MADDQHVIEPRAVRAAVVARLDRRMQTEGEISFPAAPALLDHYLERLALLFTSMGKKLSESEFAHLKNVLEPRLHDGFKESVHARVHVKWESEAPPGAGLDYRIWLAIRSLEEQYEHWASSREPPFFGANPDAKLLSVVELLGQPSKRLRILDVGAGTGRNALPLARAGYSVDALETTGAFSRAIAQAAEAERLPVKVIQGNALASELRVASKRYALVVCSEVTTHFRGTQDLRLLFERVAQWLEDGGWFLVNVFVAIEGYEPDQLAREVSQIAWSTLFTRRELEEVTHELPLTLVSDDPVHAYETAHQPARGWPPTEWFEDWSRGFNCYGVDKGLPPMDLRWLLYQKSRVPVSVAPKPAMIRKRSKR